MPHARYSRADLVEGSALASQRPSTQAAAAGADGVIVESRLVRTALEAADPVTATGVLTARFAAALA